MVSVGAVLSRFTARVAVALLPAWSVAVPVMIWFCPSVVTVTGDEIDATPESGSVAVKLTTGLVLFQPAELGAGMIVEETMGTVLSILRVTVAVALFPARSVAVPEIIWPAPSAVTETGLGQVATPLVASEQVNVTVTLVLFHPAALGNGFTKAVIVGGVLSTPITVIVT